METYSRATLIGTENLFDRIRSIGLHTIGFGLLVAGIFFLGRNLASHTTSLVFLGPAVFTMFIGLIIGIMPLSHWTFDSQKEYSVVEILEEELESSFESGKNSGLIFESSMNFLAQAALFYLTPLEHGTCLSASDVEFIKQVISSSASMSEILEAESNAANVDFEKRRKQLRSILELMKSEPLHAMTNGGSGPNYLRIVPPAYTKKITDIHNFLRIPPSESSKDENFGNALVEACSILYLSSLIISMFSPVAWKQAYPGTLALMDAVMDYLDRSGPFSRKAKEIQDVRDKLKKSTDTIYLPTLANA